MNHSRKTSGAWLAERARIRIGVRQDGSAAIEILNESGELVQRFPETR
jgi:hypothetical protein